MAFGSVTLIPGVNAERTPTLLRAGIVQSGLIRFRDSLVQKMGGWVKFFPFTVAGVPRDMHAWEDLNAVKHLSVGTTAQLGVITSNVLKDITPQTLVTNGQTITTAIGSSLVTIVDPGVTNVTVYDSIFFNVPVSMGGIILDGGPYPIAVILGPHSYQINAPKIATASASATTPQFTTVSGSILVNVMFAAHGRSVGDTVVFAAPTTFNGVTIFGSYQVTVVTDANNFSITLQTQATASGSLNMNGGTVQLVYYLNFGAPPLGVGYGVGPYGSGGYGLGITPAVQTGVPLAAADWTTDNWGEILLACPRGGGLYFWDPTGGFTNAGIVTSGPPFNNGMFVSMSQQIVVMWGSSTHQGIGVQQNPMLVQWSDVSNFFQFAVSAGTQAGNFVIPIGSEIRGGMAVSNQNLIWTDLDLWAMNYIGPPNVFGFTKVGTGGLISSHAAQQLRGSVYWMGDTNFYAYNGGSVSVVPSPVWDVVFQNLNTAFASNIRAMPNTPFNEVGWEFPSLASSGENDSYVKFNITEPGAPWDYGIGTQLQRSAWIDRNIFGNPIGAASNGVVYQHESTNDADTQPMLSGFLTGYFYIAEGEEFAFVDQIYPDFKWTTFAGGAGSAQIQMSFLVVNSPGDTPITYGPYTVTQTTKILSVRFRGRQMAISVFSNDVGSFWRLGYCRYRYSPMGRR
jgi:hypothetical protein